MRILVTFSKRIERVMKCGSFSLPFAWEFNVHKVLVKKYKMFTLIVSEDFFCPKSVKVSIFYAGLNVNISAHKHHRHVITINIK